MHPGSSAWSDAWLTAGLREPPGLFDSLIARYEEPHRAYHNLRHLEECFDALGTASHLAERLDEAHLAIWFHDAVYDPRADDNEIASAELARQAVLAAGGNTTAADRMVNIILATRHDIPAELADAQLVADVDLAILAAPVGRFDEYQRQIAEEYAFMPTEEFQLRRAQILEGFLARPAIYQTVWFRVRLEHAARANISNELVNLRGRNTR